MPNPKLDRLLTGGSVREASYRGSNIELAVWVFVLISSLLALAYWGS